MNSLNLIRNLTKLPRYLNNLRSFSSSMIFKNNEENKIIYTATDEWICNEKKNQKIGLTQNAIDQLSELVYIEYLFQPGDSVSVDEQLVVVESVKATGTINAPFDLTIIQNNIEIEDDLSIINEEPENIENSWFIKVKKNEENN